MEKSKVVDGEMVMNTSKKKQGSGTGFKVAVLCIAGLALILSAGSTAMSAYIILKGDWSGNSISSDGGYYLGEMPEFEEDTIAGVAEKT